MGTREDIPTTAWAVFIGAVVVCLALDLGVFHRRARVVRFREALVWTSIWCASALLFAFALAPHLIDSWGADERAEFLTGYLTELSLSMDNVFVIALIFAYFRVPLEFQHRVLFWGILGALAMRGAMILLGVALLERFDWMLYVLGGFLIITGVRMAFAGSEEVHPERNLAIRGARWFFPVSSTFAGQHFFTRLDGRLALTPLALVLLMVETTDLIFALDSIPAIFGITQNPFVVFTSNVFAILGLRSLYFVLAGAIDYFRFLKIGLSVVLVFIGVKMLVELWHVKIPTFWSLGVVVGIILLSIVVSLLHARKGRSSGSTPPGPAGEGWGG